MTPPSAPVPDTIVVGIDGSADSDRALEWAARQAALEHRPLTIAHASHLSAAGDVLGALRTGADLAETMAAAGHCLLDDADRRVHALVPALTVHRAIRTDVDARQMLTELAATASSLVLGSRGRGPIASALLGSVSVKVARHAVCPVVVVRRPGDAPAGSGVMVEVTGDEASRAAVDHAFRMASLHGWDVTLVRTVWVPSHLGAQCGDVGAQARGLDEERAPMDAVTARMATEHPDVSVRTRLVNGVREHALVQASTDADLLVLGSRRLSSLDDMLQRSSVVTVVEHASCDVVVVPFPRASAASADSTGSTLDEVLERHVPAQA